MPAPQELAANDSSNGADIRRVKWLNAKECLEGEPLDMVKCYSVADDMGMDRLCAVVFDLVIALGRGLRGKEVRTGS